YSTLSSLSGVADPRALHSFPTRRSSDLLFDVVGRIGLRAVGLAKGIQHCEQAIKADGRAIKGGKVQLTHSLFSFEQQVAFWCLQGPERRPDGTSGPDTGGRIIYLGALVRRFKTADRWG